MAKQQQSKAAEKLRVIFYSIGFAMTQWQHVENAITHLFTILVRGHNGASSAAINCVFSTRTRLLMVRAAASTALKHADADLFDECVSLCDRVDKKATKRNEIAHFFLYQTSADVSNVHTLSLGDYIRSAEKIDWYLSPMFFDGARQWRYGVVPKLTANDLMNRARAFGRVAGEIESFSEKARAALSRRPKRA